jgi:hypothetical protein
LFPGPLVLFLIYFVSYLFFCGLNGISGRSDAS